MPKYRGITLGDFTGTGAGTAVNVEDLEEVKVSVTGTFVGTLDIEVSFDAVAFVALESVTAVGLVPSTVGVLLPPCARVRGNCTAYTSGTIEARLGGRDLDRLG